MLSTGTKNSFEVIWLNKTSNFLSELVESNWQWWEKNRRKNIGKYFNIEAEVIVNSEKWTQNVLLVTFSASASVRFYTLFVAKLTRHMALWIMMRVGFIFFTLDLDSGCGKGQRLQAEGSRADRWVCGGVVGRSADQGRGVDGCCIKCTVWVKFF